MGRDAGAESGVTGCFALMCVFWRGGAGLSETGVSGDGRVERPGGGRSIDVGLGVGIGVGIGGRWG